MTLLDTSVLIDVSKGGRTAASLRAQAAMKAHVAAGEGLFTSRLNEAEFRVGPWRSSDPAGEALKVEDVLAVVAILEFDGAAAAAFGQIKALLLGIGRFPGDMDVLIAAVALVNNQKILTRNPRHFADVPALVVETY